MTKPSNPNINIGLAKWLAIILDKLDAHMIPSMESIRGFIKPKMSHLGALYRYTPVTRVMMPVSVGCVSAVNTNINIVITVKKRAAHQRAISLNDWLKLFLVSSRVRYSYWLICPSLSNRFRRSSFIKRLL